MYNFAIRGAAAAACLALAAPASAAVVVYTSAGPVQPDENVLFDIDQPLATSVTGSTNNTNSIVNFTSNVLLDVNGSQGAARISAATGSIDQLTISLADPNLYFTQFEFNLFQATRGTTNVTFTFSDGTSSVQSVSANGQNYFGFLATGTTQLTSISFDSNGAGFNDVRQVRIGGIASAAVPEPMTWALLILGFGITGAAMRARTQRARQVRGSFTFA